MTSYILSPVWGAGAQLFDNSGNVLTGGKIETYEAGTTTNAVTYTDPIGSVFNSNPIIADASGRLSNEIWLPVGNAYKFVLKDTNNVLIATYDNIPTTPQPLVVNDASSISYQQGYTVTAGAFTVGATYLITSVGTTNFVAIGAAANVTGILFTATGVGSGNGTAEYSRTVQTKLRETVSVKDFGAVGDGVTDDTVAIQAALNSGASVINFSQGTYIINGGLTLTAPNTTLVCTGATIKLKNNASSLQMLFITGAGCTVDGGIWDGNKANGNIGVWGSAQFGSFNIAMYADRCTVKNIDSINTWGIGIKGFANYLSALNNRIRNTENYGIFFDGSASVSHTGNRAIGNTIDMSEGFITTENQGQGILFAAGTGQAQIDWELSNNNIIGPQTSVGDQGINLAVRGRNGIVSNNTTRYGAMGFSEGGANTVIDGNRFLDLVGTVRYGIEPSGGATVISNNTVTNALRGVIASGDINFDGLTITGNHLDAGATGTGVNLQIGATESGKNIVISGNYLKGTNGVYTTRDVTNLTISGNVIVGPSPTFASGRGVFIDTPSANAYVFITGNTIVDVQRSYTIYSLGATTFNYLFATNNNLSLAGTNTNSSIWTAEGLAVIGTPVVSANNINPSTIGLEFSVVNQGSNIRIEYGTASPEGSVTANVGSLFINKSGGAGTTLYVKQTGTGNTGWAGLS
jgi:hypothetical protein